MSQYADPLLQKGWVVVNINKFDLNEKELLTFASWEDTFQKAFDLSAEVKVHAGEYRVEHGVSVGYRHDEEREFLETRLSSSGACEPNFHDIVGYSDTIAALYSALNRIAVVILNEISDLLGWDRSMLLDLTDLKYNGVLPFVPVSSGKKTCDADSNVKSTDMRQQYSSSLLRICKYVHDVSSCGPKPKSVSFGAHTDSSFITVAPVSTTPGLEVVDQQGNYWTCPELISESSSGSAGAERSSHVLVFVGEFLQVLTKNRFKATVHRVVEFPSSSSNCTNGDTSTGEVASKHRISCPYLIRGLNDAVINMHDEKYHHQEDSLTTDKVPDLDGTTMKLLHKLLDLKRQKCFRDNDSKPGSWVLSAFPIENMPVEEEEKDTAPKEKEADESS